MFALIGTILFYVLLAGSVAWFVHYNLCFLYWKRRGFPYLKPSFPFGSIPFSALGKRSIYVVVQDLYNEIKDKGLSGAGIYCFNGPIYVPTDTDLVKRILISDFDHFVDRGFFYDVKNYPLTKHILSKTGQDWRESRVKFTPQFTSGKIKTMFEIFKSKAQKLVNVLDRSAQNQEIVDIQDYLIKATVEIIGTVTLGIESNCLENPNTEFFKMVDSIFNQPKWRFFEFAIVEGFKNPGKILKITHSDRKIEKYFYEFLNETVKYRKTNNVKRDDFLDILIEMLDKGEIDFAELVAQTYLFFTAGYETSSSTMSFCIHELAHNQKLQDEVRAEIHNKLGKDSSKYTYDNLMDLPLLDRVIKETLRKYPVLAVLNRECTKDWDVPNTNLQLKKGDLVLISVLGLQRDPEFYPNPLKFDPSRFENDVIVPNTYLPFGLGPRNCVGMRFGQVQTKLITATILCHYKFDPVPGVPYEIEFDPKPTAIVIGPINHIQAIISKV